ncbi:hypothetical protein [Comamonas sp.]|uniref:hypothetical protein n=1 Tax=Comamonas sp. TaxID=34028 RepID=UPI0025829DDA|nr:hypothetical protein [Comamonas sp.]
MNPGTKGLRRTGFKSQGKGFKAGACTAAIDVDAHIIDGDERFVVQDDDRHAARAARQLVSAHETRELVALVGVASLVSTDVPACAPIEKEHAIQHEGYRRLVASMDCMWCGRSGRSNHAHENEAKGKGLKLDDRRAMPLCVDDMGKTGCHTAFDQYALVDGGRDAHVELGRAMAKHTRQIILKVGKWPKGLSLWPEDTIETGSVN